MARAEARDPRRSRVWEIQSQCYYNGKAIWTEDIVSRFIEILEQDKNDEGKPLLQKWAWCLHNQDKYTENDETDEHFWYLVDDVPGETMVHHSPLDDVPDHIHLVLQFANARYDTALAEIIRNNLVPDFSVMNIRPPKARYKAFMAIATYLSHKSDRERLLGKHLYDDSEIHCGGFDYKSETDAYLINKDTEIAKIKKDKNYLADRLVDELERGEITIDEAKEKCKQLKGFSYFLRNEKLFRGARSEYIKKTYKMKPRINIYIHGGSGTGKSTFTKYLACALFPELPEDEVVFTVGGQGVRFDGYDEQMVIIWEDIRGEALRKEYSVEGVLNLMELNPKKRAYNVKFGKVTLTHQVNIFTTPAENRDDFFENLLNDPKEKDVPAKQEDVEQVKRRFPIVISLGHTELDVFCNEKIFGGDKNKPSNFKLYSKIVNVNIAELNNVFSKDALQAAFDKITAPIVKLYKQYKAQMSEKEKLSEQEDAPVNEIEVYEGDQEVKDVNDKIKERYINACEEYLEAHRLQNGEFGPYNNYHSWCHGDELSGKYSGAYAPLRFEEWKKIGYPSTLETRFSPYDTTRDEAEARRFNYSIPPSTEENDKEIEKEDLLYFAENVTSIEMAAEKFIQSGLESDLMTWIFTIEEYDFPIPDYCINTVYMDRWMQCWESVKSACMDHHIISAEKEWYTKYQEYINGK